MAIAEFETWFKALPLVDPADPWKDQKGFKPWMAKVNAVIARKTGLTADDLPDYCYQDDFEDGATPAQAAAAAIRYANEG